MTHSKMTNSELEGATGGHEVTPLLTEVTKRFRMGASTDVALSRGFPWWKGRRGDTKERGSISF